MFITVTLPYSLQQQHYLIIAVSYNLDSFKIVWAQVHLQGFNKCRSDPKKTNGLLYAFISSLWPVWNIYLSFPLMFVVVAMTTYLLVVGGSKATNGHIRVDRFNRDCLYSEWTKGPTRSLIREVTCWCLKHKHPILIDMFGSHNPALGSPEKCWTVQLKHLYFVDTTTVWYTWHVF